VSGVPEVSPQEALALVRSGTKLIDVREQDEWDAGHASEATLIPMSEIQGRLAELPAEEQFLLICRSGARSERVAAFLNAEGFDAVNVGGGMLAWPGTTSEGPSAPTV
jgi:rhodanese-related sulfurtransferase